MGKVIIGMVFLAAGLWMWWGPTVLVMRRRGALSWVRRSAEVEDIVAAGKPREGWFFQATYEENGRIFGANAITLDGFSAKGGWGILEKAHETGEGTIEIWVNPGKPHEHVLLSPVGHSIGKRNMIRGGMGALIMASIVFL